MPGISNWPELNVRTYVSRDGKPGVWFFSLDATNVVAVEAAKRLFRLPYYRAQMRCERRADFVLYESARLGAAFSARYRGSGDLFHAQPGSLEWFLAERYCLYATDAHGALHRAEIHHPPWPLQRAEVEIQLTSIAPLELSGSPLCHFSRSQDVVIWPLEAVL